MERRRRRRGRLASGAERGEGRQATESPAQPHPQPISGPLYLRKARYRNSPARPPPTTIAPFSNVEACDQNEGVLEALPVVVIGAGAAAAVDGGAMCVGRCNTIRRAAPIERARFRRLRPICTLAP